MMTMIQDERLTRFCDYTWAIMKAYMERDGSCAPMACLLSKDDPVFLDDDAWDGNIFHVVAVLAKKFHSDSVVLIHPAILFQSKEPDVTEEIDMESLPHIRALIQTVAFPWGNVYTRVAEERRVGEHVLFEDIQEFCPQEHNPIGRFDE
jgi:hypothetical protein